MIAYTAEQMGWAKGGKGIGGILGQGKSKLNSTRKEATERARTASVLIRFEGLKRTSVVPNQFPAGSFNLMQNN